MHTGTGAPDSKQRMLRFFRDRHVDAVISDTEHGYTLLFNRETFTVPQFFSALMKEVADSVFSGNVSVGIGLCDDNLTAVSQSYKEALWAITDPKRSAEQHIVCYSQLDGADLYGYADFQEALHAHNYTSAEAYHITVVHYITQLRIAAAKHLILTTDMDIKAVAAASGFSSDISFIRGFKKYEATTPGTFRKAQGRPQYRFHCIMNILGVAYRSVVRRSVRGCRYAGAEIPAPACTKGRMLQHTPLSPPAANACGHPHHPLLREAIYSDLLCAYARLFICLSSFS